MSNIASTTQTQETNTTYNKSNYNTKTLLNSFASLFQIPKIKHIYIINSVEL